MILKKHFFLFLCFFSVFIHAQNKNSEILLSLFNDSWGGGLTPIYDDLRSYHFQFEYNIENKLKVFSKLSFLTNRFEKNISERKSTDEFMLNAALPIFKFKKNKNDNLWVKAGVLVTGDIFGSKIQEMTHSLFDVKQTDLTSEKEKKLYFTLGYILEKNIFIKELSNTKSLQLSVNNILDYHHNYQSNISFGAPLTVKSAANSKIILTPGYTFINNHKKDNHLLSKVFEVESGFNLDLKVFSKGFFYTFKTFPFHNFSYGGIGYRFTKKRTAINNNDTSFKLKIGASVLSNGFGYNYKYAFNQFQFLNRETKIIINHNFHTFLKKYIPNSPTINGHGNQVTVGLEMLILKNNLKKRVIEPFINLSIGDKAISIYSKEIDLKKQVSHHFVINNDVGFNLLIPIKFISDTALDISFYHRLLFQNSLTPEKESTFVSSKNNPYTNIQNLFGFGINVNL